MCKSIKHRIVPEHDTLRGQHSWSRNIGEYILDYVCILFHMPYSEQQIEYIGIDSLSAIY